MFTPKVLKPFELLYTLGSLQLFDTSSATSLFTYSDSSNPKCMPSSFLVTSASNLTTELQLASYQNDGNLFLNLTHMSLLPSPTSSAFQFQIQAVSKNNLLKGTQLITIEMVCFSAKMQFQISVESQSVSMGEIRTTFLTSTHIELMLVSPLASFEKRLPLGDLFKIGTSIKGCGIHRYELFVDEAMTRPSTGGLSLETPLIDNLPQMYNTSLLILPTAFSSDRKYYLRAVLVSGFNKVVQLDLLSCEKVRVATRLNAPIDLKIWTQQNYKINFEDKFLVSYDSGKCMKPLRVGSDCQASQPVESKLLALGVMDPLSHFTVTRLPTVNQNFSFFI